MRLTCLGFHVLLASAPSAWHVAALLASGHADLTTLMCYIRLTMWRTLQLAYNRGLISLDERNRVYRVMKRLQLPFWHPVCCTALFYKVCPLLLHSICQLAVAFAECFVSLFSCNEWSTNCCQPHVGPNVNSVVTDVVH